MKGDRSRDRPMHVRRVPMIMEDVMTTMKRYVPSPVGNVTQVYDDYTGMYLGHVVRGGSIDDRTYTCTRIDAHESRWCTPSYGDAVAYVGATP